LADLSEVSIKIKNYKSFGNSEQGYDGIRPVNLIIGRNNTGKSTLLDLIDYATAPANRNLNELGHGGQQPEIFVTNALREDELRQVFRVNTSGGGFIPGDHWEFGSRWIGAPMTWKLDSAGSQTFVTVDPPITA
jgi:putative ATP-dependent endonuclease of OLD family